MSDGHQALEEAWQHYNHPSHRGSRGPDQSSHQPGWLAYSQWRDPHNVLDGVQMRTALEFKYVEETQEQLRATVRVLQAELHATVDVLQAEQQATVKVLQAQMQATVQVLQAELNDYRDQLNNMRHRIHKMHKVRMYLILIVFVAVVALIVCF